MRPEGDELLAALVDDVVTHGVALAGPEDATGIEAYLRSYYAGIPRDDLVPRSATTLAAIAIAHRHLAALRPPGHALVRVSAPRRAEEGWEAKHSLVQVVTDDMPFLVDSVTMELERHDLGLHLVVHPVFAVRRDAEGRLLELPELARADGNEALESFLCVEVDRETDPERLDALARDLERVLGDVRAATEDWDAMLTRLRTVVAEAEALASPGAKAPIGEDDRREGVALLHWLGDAHFTFLGARSYDLVREGGEDELRPVPGSGLGLLRGAPESTSRSFAALPAFVRARARDRSLLVLTKANRRSTVHRPTYLDYVGVRRFDEQGAVIGEHRFLGLYTASAYHASAVDVPVLRRKVAAVVDRAGFMPASHDHKDLLAILESYPRDDLFQIDLDTLSANAMGILHLQERRHVRVFLHREVYARFVSAMVFLPRDRYTTPVRQRVAEILTETFRARSHEWNVRLGESVLARLHFVLHVDPHDDALVDAKQLESRIATATRSWVDDLRETLVDARGEEAAIDVLHVWGDAFPAAYREDFDAREALADLVVLESLDDRREPEVRVAPLDGSNGGGGTDENHAGLKLYGTGPPPALSDVFPTLTNMGVIVDDERPYDLTPADRDRRWIKYFRMRVPEDAVTTGAIARLFEDAFLAVLSGRAEDDGFNRLVVAAGLSWREASLLRAYSRYLRQIGSLYSQQYIEAALATHPGIARGLVELFVARLDPWLGGSADTDRLLDELAAAIDAVSVLDEDRILRSLLHLVNATLRTNWFRQDTDEQREGDRPTIVLKLDPARIPDLPAPRPLFEIFVYSPRVEGVHLRAGRVARGGIRWSDRREDFRTEVLGLMKAQRVKNVVIVPGGAKGGFVVKRPPARREDLPAEVEACYREFIAGLLDVTDNLVDGTVVAPPQVVRYDGDDPYLVVAADRGTATFSDLANELALARRFWLGDAFASGGSTGYDHKEMGITARGVWVSVVRHFRELGVDVQTTDFTVVGIGDMSGDVFGNGMLLSEHIRLVAAFDHRHVFLDPDPDPARAFAERKRLFALPRSSWDDYDRSVLSAGGGVHARTAKSIGITPEVRARLALPEATERLTPNELVSHILRAPVDLLYNGGIGTFVKAASERHADAGDKTNDAVRVDGGELRCRVVAEGGNLGVTQRGRVEYARAGGRIYTDAIDNSAGVDCSDHEVNLKILLDRVVRAGALTVDERNDLLEGMREDVAALVLRDNYRQTRALENGEAQAPEMEEVHARFIRALEHAGDLDRAVEALPSDDELAERHAAGLGLTPPELAVLLAYAKIGLKEDLLASALPEDPDFAPVLCEYFPPAVLQRDPHVVDDHPLAREIVVTSLVNGLVNRAGTTFVFRLAEETGAAADEIVRAHEVARAVFDQAGTWSRIEALDGTVDADTQTSMYLESRKLVERASRWFLRYRKRPLPVAASITAFRPAVERIARCLPECLRGDEQQWFELESSRLLELDVPRPLAREIATMDALHISLDVATLSAACGRSVEEVVALFAVVGDELQLDWLRDRAVELPRDDRWQALARRALVEDIDAEHRRVTGLVVAATDPGFEPAHAYEVWATSEAAAIARVHGYLDDIRTHGVFDLATLGVALREIRALT